jgi:DNA-binding transcriptional LysR family regulator
MARKNAEYEMNWDDLTYLLAVMRGASLTQAARLMGVDKSTVSRRMATLEADLGATLVERARDGRITLTEAGRKVARRAETVEDEMRGLAGDLGQARELDGRVRLTAVPLVVNHLLLPQVKALTDKNPKLALELIADTRDLSLLDFDADIALRLARPRDGGQGIVARRIGVMPYGVYAACGAGDDLPWVGYEPRMRFLDHAAGIERLAAQPGQTRATLSVNDAETLLLAVQAGYGKSLFPRRIAGKIVGLEERETPVDRLPSREIWLLVRRDMRHLERIKTVIDWIERSLKQRPQ